MANVLSVEQKLPRDVFFAHNVLARIKKDRSVRPAHSEQNEVNKEKRQRRTGPLDNNVQILDLALIQKAHLSVIPRLCLVSHRRPQQAPALEGKQQRVSICITSRVG